VNRLAFRGQSRAFARRSKAPVGWLLKAPPVNWHAFRGQKPRLLPAGSKSPAGWLPKGPQALSANLQSTTLQSSGNLI